MPKPCSPGGNQALNVGCPGTPHVGPVRPAGDDHLVDAEWLQQQGLLRRRCVGGPHGADEILRIGAVGARVDDDLRGRGQVPDAGEARRALQCFIQDGNVNPAMTNHQSCIVSFSLQQHAHHTLFFLFPLTSEALFHHFITPFKLCFFKFQIFAHIPILVSTTSLNQNKSLMLSSFSPSPV